MTIFAASYAILWTMNRVFEGTCVINRLRVSSIHPLEHENLHGNLSVLVGAIKVFSFSSQYGV